MKSVKQSRSRRRLQFESLENRSLMAGDLIIGTADLPSAALLARTVAEPSPLLATPFPLADTFKLSSRPSATKTIFLDFDGHTTRGTAWNKAPRPATIVTGEYSTNSSAGFSNTELAEIQEIYLRVSEDYSPFDVNVTTLDPGVDALRNTGGNDLRWGIRVCIGNGNDWLKKEGGGAAFTNSFDWDSDTPAFIFPSELNYRTKFIADTASHEIGHTLGLHHDGRTSPQEAYYRGHSFDSFVSLSSGWAPMMGTGHDYSTVQFSKGEYPGANNQEDDLAIITTKNGFGYRDDDHGQTNATATPLKGTAGALSGSGVIERNTDRDRFRFVVQETGFVQFHVEPTSFLYGPNLAVKAKLYNSSGKLISNGTAGSAPTFNSYAAMVADPGTYFLEVVNVGYRDLSTGRGFSKYGSLGQYTVSGSIIISTNSPASNELSLLVAFELQESLTQKRRWVAQVGVQPVAKPGGVK